MEYNRSVESIRESEYPMLKGVAFLDHAGTTPPPRSLVAGVADVLTAALYGNPHSASASSQLTTSRIADVRLRLLSFLQADPADFDLVFVSNASAGVKLVVEALRAHPGGFRYVYHEASHTSLVGAREEAVESACVDDHAVEDWANGLSPLGGDGDGDGDGPVLFSYPGQSHMDGRRYPWSWIPALRRGGVYTLLDAASLATTSPVNLGDPTAAPDFMVLSLHKIFGFPDLGALVIRRAAGHVFDRRRYFGGGTVDVVVCGREQWHVGKQGAVHERLEDGTLPFHGILALDVALDVHARLFGPMSGVASHTAFLRRRLFRGLNSMRHANGEPVCVLYSRDPDADDEGGSGPVVSFNIRHQTGAWASLAEVEKLAALANIHLRTGGLCCPGGIAAALGLGPWEVRRNFSAGHKCGTENDVVGGKPTGMIRASLGASSTASDADRLVAFVGEFFREDRPPRVVRPSVACTGSVRLRVNSLTIYPVKSCAGFDVPAGTDWEVRPEGLAWDREWCLVHPGSDQALSQKKYPQMAVLRPRIDFDAGVLQITHGGAARGPAPGKTIRIPLSLHPRFIGNAFRAADSQVCGEDVSILRYTSSEVNSFFTSALGVPCVLARFPPGGRGRGARLATARPGAHQFAQADTTTDPPSPPEPVPGGPLQIPILLSNESPILMIYEPSVTALNNDIRCRGGHPVSGRAFRANVLLGPADRDDVATPPKAYEEDHWRTLTIGKENYELLGACRRCHMVCVDQKTGRKNGDVFVTLAKTRRFDGKVYFGVHMRHESGGLEGRLSTIRVGDDVRVNSRP